MGGACRHHSGCVKGTKRIKVAGPIYGAGDSAPLELLTIAAAQPGASPQLVRLATWFMTARDRIAVAKPKNDAARQLLEKCRAFWPLVAADACSTPSNMEDICEAMLHTIDFVAAYQAYAVENELQERVQAAQALRDAGKKGAAKRHGSVREAKRKIKRTDALRVANEQLKGGVPEPSVTKRLSSKLGVKLGTAKRMLRKSGHLPPARRNRSP
jgi:hypothetical protein